MITKDQVVKALDSLEANLDDEAVTKASEDDLDQPEGADLGNPAKEKMSGKAPAPSSSPKPVKKAEAEEAEESDEDEAEESTKSFAEAAPEEIQTKIDVSEFLKSLVDHTGSVIDQLRAAVVKSEANHESRYSGVVETLNEVQQSQAKIGIVLKAVCQKIGIIEASPARPAKAETVAKSTAATAEREFSSGLGNEGGEEKFAKSLSDNPVVAKSQIANALCDMVRKGEATDLDVIGFESGGFIRPELTAKLKQSLS